MTVPTGTYDYDVSSDGHVLPLASGRGDLVWALDTMAPGTSRTVHVVLASDLPTGCSYRPGESRTPPARASGRRAASPCRR